MQTSPSACSLRLSRISRPRRRPWNKVNGFTKPQLNLITIVIFLLSVFRMLILPSSIKSLTKYFRERYTVISLFHPNNNKNFDRNQKFRIKLFWIVINVKHNRSKGKFWIRFPHKYFGLSSTIMSSLSWYEVGQQYAPQASQSYSHLMTSFELNEFWNWSCKYNSW